MTNMTDTKFAISLILLAGILGLFGGVYIGVIAAKTAYEPAGLPETSITAITIRLQEWDGSPLVNSSGVAIHLDRQTIAKDIAEFTFVYGQLRHPPTIAITDESHRFGGMATSYIHQGDTLIVAIRLQRLE